MAPYLPPPDHSTLLPPLLACLPVAFVSPRPPPALLPLLSPVLRQRVQLLSNAGSKTSDGSWLPLLCWESEEASKIPSIIESSTFEPHPVSGEIELEDISAPVYRRLDEETLHSALHLTDLGLCTVYLWCENDPEGGLPGWRLSELRPWDDTSIDAGRPWLSSIGSANNEFIEAGPSAISVPESTASQNFTSDIAQDQNDDDDDGYWAQYDNTPARTPAPKRSPAPNGVSGGHDHVRKDSEAAYFAQYEQVQPEMDSDDPTADHEAIGQSSLNGNQVTGLRNGSDDLEKSLQTGRLPENTDVVHTRPSSSSSSVVAHLENSVQQQDHAERAVQQHISTTMKSLFRLARGSGMAISEFERIVHTELEVVSMLEDYE